MPVAKYRKLPVTVEAIQYTGENVIEVLEFLGDCGFYSEGAPNRAIYEPGIYILTLEGRMLARPDWWIIKGVRGEFYPCAPDVFEAIYEAVYEDGELEVTPQVVISTPREVHSFMLPGSRWLVRPEDTIPSFEVTENYGVRRVDS